MIQGGKAGIQLEGRRVRLAYLAYLGLRIHRLHATEDS